MPSKEEEDDSQIPADKKHEDENENELHLMFAGILCSRGFRLGSRGFVIPVYYNCGLQIRTNIPHGLQPTNV